MKDHKQWVSEVFDRAAPGYGVKSSSFFSYFGKRLVEQVEVKPHHRVLDVATGRGAVLFPLTKIISSEEKIIGIDISKQMIQETSIALLKRASGIANDIGMRKMGIRYEPSIHFYL